MKLPKYRPCSKCDNGYTHKVNEQGNEYVTKCDCLQKYQNRILLVVGLQKANIPCNDTILMYDIDKDYIGKDVNNIREKLKKYLNEFEEVFNDKILYFWGKKGTQKTTVSYWIGKELIKKNISIRFILMNDLVKQLQDANFNEEVDIDQYYNCDCLIIDRAFCKDQVTIYKSGYQLPFLDNFLRKRIDVLQKSTIVISNEHYDNIAKNGFNEDIEDLIRRKVQPYQSVFHFIDSYTLKDDFDTIDLWR